MFDRNSWSKQQVLQSRALNAGNSTTRVMKMLPGYPFKPLNNSVSKHAKPNKRVPGYPPGIGKPVPG